MCLTNVCFQRSFQDIKLTLCLQESSPKCDNCSFECLTNVNLDVPFQGVIYTRPPSNPHPQQRLTGLPQLPSEYILGRCALYNIAIEYTVILAQKESTHESCVVPTSVYISVCACLPSYSIPCHGFVWFCMVWCGFVWFCMVLYDFVWFCMMYWHCHS